MSKKLIAIDLDGTTLNNNRVISPVTKKVLQAAQAKGNIVSIVTGRPNRISQNFYDELGLNSAMINFNGALAHIPHQQWAHEYEYTIPRDLVFDVLRMKREFGIEMVAAEGKHMMLADTVLDEDFAFFPKSLSKQQLLTSQNLQTDPASITIFVKREDQATIRRRILDTYPDVAVNVWGGPASVLEIVHAGIQKAKGVAYLADYYHINQKDIIAFGDESNDNEMIDYAGWGVAMANGTEHLRSIANDVTPLPNTEDGLAQYLKSYLKLAE